MTKIILVSSSYLAYPWTSSPFWTIPNWPLPSCCPLITEVPGNIISLLFISQLGRTNSSFMTKLSFLSFLFSSVLFSLIRRVFMRFTIIQETSKKAVTPIVMGTINWANRSMYGPVPMKFPPSESKDWVWVNFVWNIFLQQLINVW